jgi:hypothetical protein
VRGIHGSGVRGIHGSGVRGIHGSGVRGIHGSGVRGIHGSGLRAEDDVLASSSDAVSQPSSDDTSFELAAMGPVDSIVLNDDGSTTIVVLGQSFVSGDSNLDVSVGDYVFAASVGDGSLDILLYAGEEYLVGVSPIQVLGPIDVVDSDLAQFTIGGTTFDFASLLSEDPGFAPASGDLVEVTGNQFQSDAPVLLGIHGSGVRGIHGSGVRGIHGSGVRGIHGSGVRGIHGSGVR